MLRGMEVCRSKVLPLLAAAALLLVLVLLLGSTQATSTTTTATTATTTTTTTTTTPPHVPELVVEDGRLLMRLEGGLEFDPAAVMAQVATLESQLQSTQSSAAAAVSTLEEQAAANHTALASLLSQLASETSERAADLAATVDSVDVTVATLGTRVDTLQGRVGANENTLNTINTALDSVETSVESIEGKVEFEGDRVTNLESDIEHLPGVLECAQQNSLYHAENDTCIPSRALACDRTALADAVSSNSVIVDEACHVLFGNQGCLVQCATGFEGEPNAAVAICEKSGEFSVPSLSCQQVKCGPPPSVEHAQVSCTGHQYEDTCTYSCSFPIGGDEQLTCGANKQWQGTPRRCSQFRPWVVEGSQVRFPKEEAGSFTSGSCPRYFVSGNTYEHGGITFITGPYKAPNNKFAVPPNEQQVEVVPPIAMKQAHYLLSGGRSTGFSFHVIFTYEDGTMYQTGTGSIAWDCDSGYSNANSIAITHLGGYGSHGCCDQWYRLYAVPSSTSKTVKYLKFTWSGGSTDIFAITAVV